MKKFTISKKKTIRFLGVCVIVRNFVLFYGFKAWSFNMDEYFWRIFQVNTIFINLIKFLKYYGIYKKDFWKHSYVSYDVRFNAALQLH